MQRTNDTLGGIGKTKGKEKKVTFALEPIEHAQVFTPYREINKNPNFSRMKRDILQYLGKQKYEDINSYLSAYTAQEIEAFYLQHGGLMFTWAMNYSPTAEALFFLLTHAPSDVMQNILSDKGFSILDSFLGSESVADRNGEYNQEKINIAVEKVKHLLSFGNEAVCRGLEEIANASYITENVRECLNVAKWQLSQINMFAR